MKRSNHVLILCLIVLIYCSKRYARVSLWFVIIFRSRSKSASSTSSSSSSTSAASKSKDGSRQSSARSRSSSSSSSSSSDATRDDKKKKSRSRSHSPSSAPRLGLFVKVSNLSSRPSGDISQNAKTRRYCFTDYR